MRGRLPAGPQYVEKLCGSEQAKQRLEMIRRTLAGTCRVQDACARLDVSEASFHQLRHETLQAALQRLEPRAAGRPAAASEDPRLVELRQQLQLAQLELLAAQTREEIALVLPSAAQQLAAEPQQEAPGKKPSRRR